MDLPILIPQLPGAALHWKLATALAQVIEVGRLKPGSPFPSTRELADSTHLSRATVVKGMSELRRHGYVVTRVGGKTYVASDPPRHSVLTSGVKAEAPVNFDGQNLLDAAPDREIQLSAHAHNIVSLQICRPTSADAPELNYGAPPHWALPRGIWKRLLAKRCDEIDGTNLEYSPHPFGLQSLRNGIADYLRRVKAINCDSREVIVFPGSQGALASIASLLINDGDIVCVENPGYVGARNSFAAVGAEVLPVPIDDQGLRVDKLRDLSREVIDRIKLIYVTPSFHDPTGVEMPIVRRIELIKFAALNDILIVEDGWDSDHIYVKPHLPTIRALNGGKNVIYLYSFWKALYPLSSAGCMVVPERFVNVFERAKALVDRQNPALEHQALADYISGGYFERGLKRTTQSLASKRKELITALKTGLGERVSVTRQSAAFWLCITLRSSKTEQEVSQAATKAGLVMKPVSQYLAKELDLNESISFEHRYLLPFGNMDGSLNERVRTFASLV